MRKGGAPRDCSAPIVTSEKDFLLIKLVGDGDDIGDQLVERVSSDSGRFAAEIVPALVGHNDAKTCGGERLDLLPPPVPEFREAVQQHNHRAVLGAGIDCMQPYR